MYKGQRITAVLPAHEEERHVGAVVRTMPAFVDHVVVVDDASRDDTSGAARAAGDARVEVIRAERNLGVGGATMLGYRRGAELGSDVLVKMDGDGQMDPEYLAPLLDAVVEGGYDYAKGNRFLAGESLARMPKVRLIGNVVLTFLTKLASGYWHIFDPQNGYTALRADALRVIDLEAVDRRFFFENDMLSQLNYHNKRVKDVAIPARYRDEVSDLNPFKVGVTFPALLVRRFFRRLYQKYVLRDFSPIALFMAVGFLLFAWGFCFGVYTWVRSNLTGHPTPTGTIMLALLPLILGFQLLLQAIVLDIHETPR